jgi:hypothetical protein
VKGSILLESLAELRTQCSIIGLSSSQLIKRLLPEVKKEESMRNCIKMLDGALTRFNEHVFLLEKIIKDNL